MSKKVRSDLQLAADRVRQMQTEIATVKSNLEMCMEEYNTTKAAFDEATRNLKDTQDFHAFQRSKLDREIQSVRDIVGDSTYGFLTKQFE